MEKDQVDKGSRQEFKCLYFIVWHESSPSCLVSGEAVCASTSTEGGTTGDTELISLDCNNPK
jgi:hypothetical protein